MPDLHSVENSSGADTVLPSTRTSLSALLLQDRPYPLEPRQSSLHTMAGLPQVAWEGSQRWAEAVRPSTLEAVTQRMDMQDGH